MRWNIFGWERGSSSVVEKDYKSFIVFKSLFIKMIKVDGWEDKGLIFFCFTEE